MILDEITCKTRERIETLKRKISLNELKSRVADSDCSQKNIFEDVLKKQGLSFICEVKKASPSKGIISSEFPYVEIAKEYEEAGADIVSVLTEPFYFKGSNEYLQKIRQEVRIPILRKDFTIDEYMIYEAKVLGADGILLISSILGDEQIKEYYQIAKSIGLSVLVETHNEEEVRKAVKMKATIIGVNNRNLNDFTVDLENSITLKKLVPDDRIFVSESGMSSIDDLIKLKENGTNAVLIGEMLMRSNEKKELIEKLKAGKEKIA